MKDRYLKVLVLTASLGALFYTNAASACVYANRAEEPVSTPAEGIRWPGIRLACSGPAVVHMVNDSQDPNVWYAFEFARQNWNEHSATTGVTIVPAEVRAQGQIFVSEVYDNWGGDGIAQTKYTSVMSGSSACSSTPFLEKVNVFVNLPMVQQLGLVYGQIYGTAVHELGHALGLHHDDNGCTAMKPMRYFRQEGQCHVYHVTPTDASCVAAAYN